MGRPLRRQVPGQYYLFTTRCHQARFLLRPSDELNQVVLEWLTRGQLRFPSMRIHAVCVMSNHIHLVLRDDAGELADWASYVLGNLARAVNRVRGRRGAFFERRYSAEPILDIEALHDRLVYVVTNPVKAHLCERTSRWPGLVLFAPDEHRKTVSVSWLDRDAYRNGKPVPQSQREPAVASQAFRVKGTLAVDPIPEIDGPGSARMAVSVEARERALADDRAKAGRRALTVAEILRQKWHSTPRSAARSTRPLCHAGDPAIRAAFKDEIRAFVGVFREASLQLRQGVRHVTFPDWSFPPGRELIRPQASFGGPLTA